MLKDIMPVLLEECVKTYPKVSATSSSFVMEINPKTNAVCTFTHTRAAGNYDGVTVKIVSKETGETMDISSFIFRDFFQKRGTFYPYITTDTGTYDWNQICRKPLWPSMEEIKMFDLAILTYLALWK